MTDRVDVGPDPLVQAAVQLLPVPDHGDDFWDELAQHLDDADVPRGTAAPVPAPSVFALVSQADPTPVPSPRPVAGPEPTLAVIPPAMRRRSNVVLAAVAVVALLVVGVAGAALVREQSGAGTDLADGAGGRTNKELDELVASSQGPAGIPDPLSKKEVAASRDAVTGFADDHAAGGTAPAWQQVLVTPVSTGEGETLAVVTLVGTDTTEAYAVRLTADGAQVIAADTAGSIELVTPEPLDDDETEATVTAGDDLVVVLPAGSTAPVLRLDDGTPVICGEAEGTHFGPMEEMARVRCAWTPPALSAGEHTLTVAFVGDDGTSISADSVAFQAA